MKPCKKCFHYNACITANPDMVKKTFECKFFEDKEKIKIALEKQIPKKPTNYSIDNNGYMIYDCECLTCKCSHREYYPFSYCNHCGQALDWSDTE